MVSNHDKPARRQEASELSESERPNSASSSLELAELALSNCGREPIHTPGNIQSCGALIVTDRALETITHVSANLGNLLGYTSDHTSEQWSSAEALGKNLRSLFPYDLLHELCNVCGLPSIGMQPERLGTYLIGLQESETNQPETNQPAPPFETSHRSADHNEQQNQSKPGRRLDVSVHVSDDHTLIELSAAQLNPARSGTSILQVKTMLDQLSDAESMLETAVQTLRQKTGFDRVMAYKFLQDGTGEIAAEAKTPALEPYLGLRYPASDIPQQVRSLALKTSFRIIHDTQAAPIPILALNQSGPPLDLSLVNLRSVSPIHLEYLGNMGVQATMNISITVEKKLWGLFAFHHSQPRQLSPELCDMLALFGQFFSLRFQQILAEEKFRARKRTASILESIVNQQTLDDDWQATIFQAHDQLRSLLLAQGLAFVSQPKRNQPKSNQPKNSQPSSSQPTDIPSTNTPSTSQTSANTPSTHGTPPQINVFGDVPSTASILALISHYQNHADADIVTIESLQQLDLNAPEKTHKNTHDNPHEGWGHCAGALIFTLPSAAPLHLIFFRNETIHEVRWGGNPEKKDIVYGAFGPRLRPRASFEEYQQTVRGRCTPWSQHNWTIALEIRTELLRLVKDRVQDFQQRQQNLLIAELNHRVKNILALIRSIARQTKESTDSLTDYATMLEQRIKALAIAHDLVAGHELEWPDLEQLLLIELQPYLSNAQPQVKLIGPAVGLKANFVPTFVLVLHELTTNAVKYGSLSVHTGQLTVRWHITDGGLTLHWEESGGPVVTYRRNGFGQELIERAIPYEFEGEADLRFHPTGVEAEFWLPSSLIRWQSPPTTSPTSAQPRHQADAPADQNIGSVLIVEDNMLLTMEMENTLKQLGFSNIDAAPSVAKALKLLKQNHYRVCVLDIDLKKETSFEIARTLVHRKIPFAFTSGYDSKHAIPEDLVNHLLVKKPIELAKLQAALQALVPR